jgi:hypothetical protein
VDHARTVGGGVAGAARRHLTQSKPVLLPREHGTYGEILFPLTSALVLGSPGGGAWGLACVAVTGFLAHEGVLVLTGGRGPRARRAQKHVALQSVAGWGALALIGAVVAAPRLSGDAVEGVVVAAVCSSLAIVNAVVGREHSILGEGLAAVALPAWCVPVALAAGLPWPQALALWGVWAFGFVGVTCAVHVILRRSKRAPVASAVMGAFACAAAGPVFWWWAALPLSLTTVVLASIGIPTRHLRRIGWSVIVASVITLLLLWRVSLHG